MLRYLKFEEELTLKFKDINLSLIIPVWTVQCALIQIMFRICFGYQMEHISFEYEQIVPHEVRKREKLRIGI